jgi:hypothetical protein
VWEITRDEWRRLTGTQSICCAGNVSSELGIVEKFCAVLKRNE